MNLNTSRHIRFDEGSQGFLILLLISQLFFVNGIYLFIGAICFAFVLINLQQPYKPGIFTILFIYHFLQISAGIWLSNYLGKDINFRSPNTGVAIIACYVGMIALMSPIIYFNNRLPKVDLEVLKRHANRLSLKKTFTAYVVAFFATNALNAAAFLFSGLTQVIFSLVNLKWFLFLLFGYQVFVKRKMVRMFVIALLVEFASGFFSYFSDFKTVIFYAICIILTFITVIRLRHLVISIIAICIVAYLGIFWTSIKGEYRIFLNQGSRSQSVQVSQEEALNKLIDLTQSGRADKTEDPVADLLDRLQYTFHLAKTMDNVPASIPYQYGSNWGGTLEYVLTPRVLNPDKPKFEATVKTKKYTGLAYAGQKQGASFSLGYFADGFIDFGLVGMMLPLLILGFAFGFTYFYFLRFSSANLLFNYAVVGAIFLEFHAFEMDSTFLVGRFFSSCMTFLLLRFFFFPWLIKSISNPIETPSKSVNDR